jgi:cell division protein FtsB
VTAKKRWRFRWRRAVTIVIGTYLVYWTVVSVHHILVIRQAEHTLDQQIAVVQEDNRALKADIHELHNRQMLKRILSGQAPLPTITSAP